MRILVANAHGSVSGGVETYLQALLPLLGGQGHEVALAVEGAQGADPARRLAPQGVATFSVAEAGLAAVVDAARAFDPDVVYLHQLAGADLDEALSALAPTLRYLHGYTLTCVSGAKHHRFPRLQACDRPLGPGCLLRYLPRRCGGLDPRTMVRQYRAREGRARRLAGTSSLVVASAHMARELARNGVPRSAVEVLPLFPAGLTPAPAPAPLGDPNRVLFLGRLTRAKGVHLLPGALARAGAALSRPLALTVGGTGPARDVLHREAARHGVALEDLGWLGPEAKVEAMRRAALLAVPSVWPEPFGLVGPEAGCVGLPAVAFAVGGIPEWRGPGVTGELAPADPPTGAGLAAAIVRTLGDPAHYARLREGALAMSRRYTPGAHLARLGEILDAVRRRPAGATAVTASGPGV